MEKVNLRKRRGSATGRSADTATDHVVEDSLNRLTAEFLEGKGSERVGLLSRFRKERDRLLKTRGARSRAYRVAKYQYEGMEHLFWHSGALTTGGLSELE